MIGRSDKRGSGISLLAARHDDDDDDDDDEYCYIGRHLPQTTTDIFANNNNNNIDIYVHETSNIPRIPIGSHMLTIMTLKLSFESLV